MDADSPDADSARLKRQRALTVLMVSHACAAFATLVLGLANKLDYYLTTFSGLALCISQAALLGIGFAFGRRQSPRRLLICVLILLAVVFVLVFGVYADTAFDKPLALELTGLIVANFTAVALAALIAKRTGLAIGLVRELPSQGPSARLQFTTFDLFALTALVALLTVGLTSLRNALDQTYEFDIIAPLTLAVVAATLPVMAATLSRMRTGWRLMTALCIVAIALLLYFPFENLLGSYILGIAAVIELASFLIVRYAGYRLYVRSRTV